MIDWKERYTAAHREHQDRNYPAMVKDHGHIKTTFPVVAKANGLTQFVIRFLDYKGHRATRISSSGRVVGGKYIPGQTRRGAADVSATIFGRSVQLEIKVGADRPSQYQLAEQRKEIAAGGEYFFIRAPEQFLDIYDSLVRKYGPKELS